MSFEFPLKYKVKLSMIMLQNFDYTVASGGRRKEERYDQNDAECAAAHG